jgi:hypothetical protein
MKNIPSFDEFVNESILNEAFTGTAKVNIKKIGDITRKFIEKDLPSLLSKYNCTLEQSPVDKQNYTIHHAMQRDLFDIHLDKMNKNRFAISLMYCYINVFMGPEKLYDKLPFTVGDGIAFKKYCTKLVDDALSNWQTLEGDERDNAQLSDPDIAPQYQEMANNWLEGIEKNLDYYVKHNIIKN